MCFDFLNHILGYSIEPDIYFGSSKGSISIYSNNRHYEMKEKAHQGPINCLRVTDVFNNQVCIITAGEDGWFKIWTPRMENLQSVDLKQANPTPDLNNPLSYAIQSLDIYVCSEKQMASILLGIRTGDILEGEITETFEPDPEDPSRRIQKYDFSFESFISGHSSLIENPNMKKLHITSNTRYPIFVTVSDDETI